MDCDIVLLRTFIKQGINLVSNMTYFIHIPWLIAHKLSKQKENISHHDHTTGRSTNHTHTYSQIYMIILRHYKVRARKQNLNRTPTLLNGKIGR